MGRRVSMFGRPEGDGRVREVRRLCIVMGSHTQVLFIPTHEDLAQPKTRKCNPMNGTYQFL